MSWLIESFLDEGRLGPDHPESLDMKNKKDYNIKQANNINNNIKQNSRSIERICRKPGILSKYKKYTNIQQNISNSMDAKNETEKAERSNNLNDTLHHLKQAEQYKSKNANDFDKLSAIDRHNRRHPDQKVHESVEQLVESFE